MYIHPDEPVFFVPGRNIGLTKKEYFAAIAMQGLLANADSPELRIDDLAADACRYADALINELNKEENETNKV